MADNDTGQQDDAGKQPPQPATGQQAGQASPSPDELVAQLAEMRRELAATRSEAAKHRIAERDTRSEAERTADELRSLREAQAQVTRDLARERVARRYGFTDDALGLLRGDDEESITASAETLRKHVEAAIGGKAEADRLAAAQRAQAARPGTRNQGAARPDEGTAGPAEPSDAELASLVFARSPLRNLQFGKR